jgi:transcriptional regulator with XRE-family HTH domain
MIEAAQIRAARALIDWSQSKLAEAAGVSPSIVRRFEAGGPDHGADQAAIDKMRAALEAAGIAFISKNGGGAGVRLREGQKSEYLGWDDLNASNDE